MTSKSIAVVTTIGNLKNKNAQVKNRRIVLLLLY